MPIGRMWTGNNIILRFALALATGALISCTDAKTEFENLDDTPLAKPVLTDQSDRTVYSPTASVTVSGSCDQKSLEFYASCDNSAWFDMSGLSVTLTDTDCSDGDFSLTFNQINQLCPIINGTDSTHELKLKTMMNDYGSDLAEVGVNYIAGITISSTCSTTAATATEDSAYTCAAPSVTGPALSVPVWSLVEPATTCDWATIDGSGALGGTPVDNEVGTCDIAYKLTDGGFTSNTILFTVTVSNAAPTLSIADASAILEDATGTTVRSDTDVAADDEGFGVYTLVPATGTSCASVGTVSISAATGEIDFTPNPDVNGSCNVKVRFTDSNAAFVESEFAIPITAVNDSPTFNVTGTCSDDAARGSAYVSGCSFSASDVDGTTPQFFATASHDCAWASVNINTGSITGTPPDANECTIEVKVTDGVVDLLVATMAMTVTGPQLQIDEGTSYSFGTVLTQLSLNHSFTLHNVGDGPSTGIDGLGLSAPFGFVGGSFADSGDCDGSLNPGETCTFSVSYDPLAVSSDVDTANIMDSLDNPAVSLNLSGTAVIPVVTAKYSVASNWNSYAQRSDTSSTCPAGTDGYHSLCIHGGEFRKVVAYGIPSCAGLTMTETLGAFRWTCAVSGGHATFYSTGFQHGKSLPSLLNAGAADWYSNSVTIHNGALNHSSASLKWWDNAVETLPATSGSRIVLDGTDSDGTGPDASFAAGTIFVLNASTTTHGYNLNLNNSAIVIMPGAVLKAVGGILPNFGTGGETGSTQTAIVAAGSQNFVWIEGDFEGPVPFGLYLEQLRYSRLINVRVQNTASAGISLFRSRGNLLHGLRFAKAAGTAALHMNGSTANFTDYNTVSDVTISNSGGSGAAIYVNGGSNNIFSRILAVNNTYSGFEVIGSAGSRNTLTHITAANNATATGQAIKVTALATQQTFAQVLVTNNNFEGILINTGSGHKLAQILTRQNGATGLYDSSSGSHYSQKLYVDSCFANGTAGITNTTCAVQNGSTATVDTSTGLTAASFAGFQSNDDTGNPADFNGTVASSASLGTLPSYLDFSNLFRAWAPDGIFHGAGSRGVCAVTTCRIFDWQIAASPPLYQVNGSFTGGANCPASVAGGLSLTDSHATPNTFLVNALEVMFDASGDDDGLCESNENCVFSPHIGAHQGSGDPLAGGTCNFSNGTVSGVTMYGWPSP